MKVERGRLGGEELVAFGAFEIRVKHEAARWMPRRIEALEQNDADVWDASRVYGRQCHRVGVVGFGFAGFGKPGLKQGKGILALGEIACLRSGIVARLLLGHRARSRSSFTSL